jgi:two-component system, LytTR family, sensor kinase
MHRMSAADLNPSPATPLRRWLPTYALLFFGIALLQSLSELQGYRRSGGTRNWEPFLWEFSSVLLIAVLVLALYQLVRKIEQQAWPRQLLWHLAGLALFTLLHVGGMYGIRFAVYAWAEIRYDPGPWLAVLGFEAGQDAVSYLTLLLLIHGYRVWRAGQQRQQELERTRRELAEVQAARLADQVQPHFLFNTLNLIASTMHEDVQRADRLLCDLAALLRQTSQAQLRGEHSLEEELSLVQPFLALMQARFGAQRLQVQIQASAAARAARLPALLLLAPVENAIKHDVAQHRGPVRVRLGAESARRARQTAAVVCGICVSACRPATARPRGWLSALSRGACACAWSCRSEGADRRRRASSPCAAAALAGGGMRHQRRARGRRRPRGAGQFGAARSVRFGGARH